MQGEFMVFLAVFNLAGASLQDAVYFWENPGFHPGLAYVAPSARNARIMKYTGGTPMLLQDAFAPS